MAELDATATKLHVLAAPGCECQECTFIRNAYECQCPRCGRRWQAAFTTPDAMLRAMLEHSQACLKEAQAREAGRKVRPPRPAYYPVACGWCGQSWPRRFTTKTAAQCFQRSHTQMCYLQVREREASHA